MTEPTTPSLFPEDEIASSAPVADRQQATIDQTGADLRGYFEARMPALASVMVTAALSRPAGDGRWLSLYYPALHSGDVIRDLLLDVIPGSHFESRRTIPGGNYVEELGTNVNGHSIAMTFYANDETLAQLAERMQQLHLKQQTPTEQPQR